MIAVALLAVLVIGAAWYVFSKVTATTASPASTTPGI